MIYIDISADTRNVGKTTTAIQLLEANPRMWLQVKEGQRKRLARAFHLAPSAIDRIIEGEDELRGRECYYLIRDLA